MMTNMRYMGDWIAQLTRRLKNKNIKVAKKNLVLHNLHRVTDNINQNKYNFYGR